MRIACVSGPQPAREARASTANEQPSQPASARSLSRRSTLLSVAPVLAWGPGSLVDALKAESSLWRQEADLYKRKASEALSEATGVGVAAGSGSAEADAAAAGLSLDAAFAAVLLDAPLRALQQGGGSSSGTAAATAAAQGSSSGTEAAAAAAQGMPTAPALPVLDRALYERDAAALAQQELPYYRQARACGHCGEQAGSPTALADRAWFDFRSYTSYKALARQLGPELSAAAAGAAPTTLTGMERMHAGSPEMQLRAAEQAWLASGQRASPFGPGSLGAGSGQGPEEQLAAAAAAYRATGRPLPGSTVPPPLSAADALRLAVGGVLLRHAESDLAAAAAAGDQASAAAAAAVASTSPELDSIRAGVQALLAYFVGKGYCASAPLAFFGASKNEERNHQVWAVGEPAFIKYWMEAPATLRSSAALEAEEGFSQDYVAATLQAYLRRCGVASSTLKRYPSYSQPQLVANQWTLRRVAPLPPGYDWQRYQAWAPDYCPLAEEACT